MVFSIHYDDTLPSARWATQICSWFEKSDTYCAESQDAQNRQINLVGLKRIATICETFPYTIMEWKVPYNS